jgi:FkbM family methyltransferase
MGLSQAIKNWVLAQGYGSRIVQLAFAIQGRMRGQRITFSDNRFVIRKGSRRIMVSGPEYVSVPFASESFDSYFAAYEAKQQGSESVLDFSQPGVHRQIASGVEFLCPGVPEEDGMPAYTHLFTPQPGMIVFDAGAHAGTTTYFLSRLVGETGHVYAFEPDDGNRKVLCENIQRHALKNVTVLPWALGGHTGKAIFSHDNSMGSGLLDFGHHADASLHREVDIFTLTDACQRLEVVPHFMKMDIEGAELGLVGASLEFLKEHPIHFAADTNHQKPNGELTASDLEALFRSIGYKSHSSSQFGYSYTWGTP